MGQSTETSVRVVAAHMAGIFPSMARGGRKVWLVGAVLACQFAPVDASEKDDEAWMARAMGTCRGCTISGHDYSGRSLFSIDLERARVSDTDFGKASLFVANFNGAKLENVSFDSANLKGAEFIGATLEDVSFEGSDLTGATFDGATLVDTSLDQAVLCFTKMPNGDINSTDCK